MMQDTYFIKIHIVFHTFYFKYFAHANQGLVSVSVLNSQEDPGRTKKRRRLPGLDPFSCLVTGLTILSIPAKRLVPCLSTYQFPWFLVVY